MKARNLLVIAVALLLGGPTVGCSDDGNTDPTNNELVDAGDDAGNEDAGNEDAGDDTSDTDPQPDAADGGDDPDTSDAGSDVGEDGGDVGADADADTGEDVSPPPPDDVDPLGGYWSDDYSMPGMVGPGGGLVTAVLRDDSSDAVYAAGEFTYAGTAQAKNIARWDGTQWNALGSGLDITANALVKDSSGTLYAAGSGGGGGGIGIGPSSNDMYTWDGTNWTPWASALPGRSTIHDMVVLSNGDIIVAGDFQGIDGVQINNVARYDGTVWTPIDPNNEPDDDVFDITVTANGFCIGGYFENIGTKAAKGAACWDGRGWSPIGAGIDGNVHALHSLGNGEFLAAGQFRVGSAYGLAKFDGSTWSGHAGGVAGGMVTNVRTLHEGPNGEIYVGGSFTYVGPNRINSSNIGRLDGTSWTALGTGVREKSRITNGMPLGVYAIASLGNGGILAGGFFTNASDAVAPNLAEWDGSQWSSYVNADSPYLGADGTVSTFAADANGDLYAGGWFGQIGTNGSAGISRFDGTTWQPMGSGLSGGVRTIAIDANKIYAGGEFQYAGPNVVSWIGEWDGTYWQPVGFGLNGPVNDMTIGPNGKLYAVGEFTLADGHDVGGVAVWDGSHWQSMGGGFAHVGTGSGGKEVNAVAVDDNGTVYVGGSFVQTSTYSVVKHLAKWNGTTWVEVGGSVEDHDTDTGATDDHGVVYDLDFWGSKLVVAGNFAKAGGVDVNSIALWDGTTYQALANGVPARWQGGRPGTVISVATKANGLFITLNTPQIDGQDVGFVGWWDGSAWHGLGDGVGDVTEALFVHDHSLYVGGPFITAAGKPSFHVARWRYDDNVVSP